MDGQNLCYKKLRKVFQCLEEQIKKVEESYSISLTYTKSLANLLEQLDVCEKVSFSKEPLSEFEYLEEKLKYKIVKAMENVMMKLHAELNVMKEVCKRISEYRRSSFEVYKQHSVQDNLSLEQTVEGSPSRPSIVELLEWLTNVENDYSELYEQKLEILEAIDYGDLFTSVDALRKWKSLIIKKTQQKYTEQVKVFLNENV